MEELEETETKGGTDSANAAEFAKSTAKISAVSCKMPLWLSLVKLFNQVKFLSFVVFFVVLLFSSAALFSAGRIFGFLFPPG